MHAKCILSAVNPLIFLSYSSKDKLVADAICSRLENQNIRCWIAPRDVNPGSDYSNQIADALEAATMMVMVFSSDSNQSRHVKSEIDRAFSLGKIIIPFRVENVELDKGLAYYLAKTHWLDAVTKPLEQHIDRLATTIRQVSGAEERAHSPRPAHSTPPAPPLAQPAQTKAIWLIGGIVVLCALVGSIGLFFLWLNQKKPETAGAPPAPQSSLAPVVAAPPSSVSPSTPAPTTKTNDVTPAPVSDRDLFEGKWTINEAETLTGNPYSGIVRISRKGQRYEVRWQSNASNASGLGIASGDKLCVGWSTHEFGVVFYKIGQDGTLKGRWITSQAGPETPEGLENASGGSPGKIEGAYLVKGTNQAGAAYQGNLKVEKNGQTFRLEWQVAGRLTKGVGIQVEDGLYVAWGEKEPFGVIGYSFEGGQAQGIWTLAGATQTATENLAR